MGIKIYFCSVTFLLLKLFLHLLLLYYLEKSSITLIPMYKPTGFVPDIHFSGFIYPSYWDGGILSYKMHKPDIFTFKYISPMLNQDKEAEYFGLPREFGGILFSQ